MSKITAIICDECPEDEVTWVYKDDETTFTLCGGCKERHICDGCVDSLALCVCDICEETFCSECNKLKYSDDDEQFACPGCLKKYDKGLKHGDGEGAEKL